MAISIDWPNGVISVPKADLTLIAGTLFEMDTDAFRLTLKDLEDDEAGMPWPRTHIHNTAVTVAGTTFARTVEIINGYSVEFEDGQYSVRLVGSNNNIFDVENGILVQNQVQLISTNSGGLIVSESGVSGLTSQEALDLADLIAIHKNKRITDPDTGVETVYEDDDLTERFTRDIFEDKDGGQPYRGRGVERVERHT